RGQVLRLGVLDKGYEIDQRRGRIGGQQRIDQLRRNVELAVDDGQHEEVARDIAVARVLGEGGLKKGKRIAEVMLVLRHQPKEMGGMGRGQMGVRVDPSGRDVAPASGKAGAAGRAVAVRPTPEAAATAPAPAKASAKSPCR